LTTFSSSLALCVVNVSSGFGIQIIVNHLTGANRGEKLIHVFLRTMFVPSVNAS